MKLFHPENSIFILCTLPVWEKHVLQSSYVMYVLHLVHIFRMEAATQQLALATSKDLGADVAGFGLVSFIHSLLSLCLPWPRDPHVLLFSLIAFIPFFLYNVSKILNMLYLFCTFDNKYLSNQIPNTEHHSYQYLSAITRHVYAYF